MNALLALRELVLRWVRVLGTLALIFITLSYAMALTHYQPSFLMEVVIILALYLLPSIVAWQRRSMYRVLAYYSNILFGWTIIGWFVAWFFAMHKSEKEHFRH